MKTEPSSPTGFKPGRHFEFDFDTVDDPYHMREKLAEPSVCGDCGAVYHEGRWQWMEAPDDASATRCSACRRIHEGLPAGHVTILGSFVLTHRDEIYSLIRHVEAREKAEHPMQRIMSFEEDDDKTLITTTDIHLARSIGDALQHAYKGELDYQYNKAEYLLRVHWQR